MSRLTCESCAAFNRTEPTAAPIAAEGIAFPMEAQCRRTPPPWATVKATDWCMGWSLRRDQRPQPDDGA